MATVQISDLKKFISKILKDADLTTLSSKMIRKRCEEQFQTDLTSRKLEIDRIVMSFISKGSGDHNDNNSDNDDSNSDDSDKSGASSDNESSDKSDSEGKSSDNESGRPESPPKAKKESQPKAKKRRKSENSNPNDKAITAAVNNSNRKKPKPVSKEKRAEDGAKPARDSDDDAALARQLQDEEWNFRSRSTRRGGPKHKEVKQKKDENKERKSRKGTSTYTRKCLLSPELAEIMESQEMARPDVVKKMWSVVRERDLFDPSNRQYALCDEQLRKVFGAKRVRMFSMMKYLKNHIKDMN